LLTYFWKTDFEALSIGILHFSITLNANKLLSSCSCVETSPSTRTGSNWSLHSSK